MNKIDQEFTVEMGQVGDCVRACTASILDLTREDVPHFVSDEPGYDWYETWTKFIEANGYSVSALWGPFENPPKLMGYYLASGPSVRGVKHMVVMHEGKLAHDPHPSRLGIESVNVLWMIKKK